MRQIRLVRISSHPHHGTFGCWVVDGQPMACTLEPYKRDNEKNISCIPTGCYLVERVNSPKYGDCFGVSNVQNRSHILIHWGNLDKHTEGCILLGESFGLLDNDWAVLSSKLAFEEFMECMKGINQAHLTITEVY